MDDAVSQSRVLRFEFEGRSYVPLLLILCGAFLMVLTVYCGIKGFGPSITSLLSVLAICMLLLWTLYFRAGQIHSDLIVSKQGLSRELFGIKWGSMPWSNVKQITVARTHLPGETRWTWFIMLHSYERTRGLSLLKPTVKFTERTKEKEDLVAAINAYAKNNHIPLFYRHKIPGDGMKWRELERLKLHENMP